MGFKVKNKHTYFGLEFDHDGIPNAVVIPSRRGQKIIEWVKSYEPVTYKRGDGKTVRRERTAVVTPIGFRLRKDEIRAAMKRNKLSSYQDGKFYVVLDHRMGEFEHPSTTKMKKDAAAKEAKTDAELPGHRQTDKHPVPAVNSPNQAHEPVTSTTESGLEVTDRRRGAGDQEGESEVV